MTFHTVLVTVVGDGFRTGTRFSYFSTSLEKVRERLRQSPGSCGYYLEMVGSATITVEWRSGIQIALETCGLEVARQRFGQYVCILSCTMRYLRGDGGVYGQIAFGQRV